MSFFQRLHVFPAEGDLGLVVRHQFIAGAGAADRVQFHSASDGVQLLLPKFRIAKQFSIRRVHQAFRDAQNRRPVRNFGQDKIRKPGNAETGDAADDEIRPPDDCFQFFNLIIGNARREVLFKFRMPSGFPADINNFFVQMRPAQPDFVPVFSGGKGERTAHHARADNCHNCHDFFSLFSQYNFKRRLLVKPFLPEIGHQPCRIVDGEKPGAGLQSRVNERRVFYRKGSTP